MRFVEPEPNIANHFSAREPQNRQELSDCFAMLEQSANYDGSLSENEIVDAWESLLRNGAAFLDVVENPAYTAGLLRKGHAPFVACLFTAFVTEEYVRYITKHPEIKYPGMDFLRRYVDFAFRGKGENLVLTAEQLAAAQAERQDQGLYFFSSMAIFNPAIDPALSQESARAKLADCVREISTHLFAGFNIHACFNVVTGEHIKQSFLHNGQRVLWEHSDNLQAADPQNKRYLLCITRNASVSKRLNIPEGVHETAGSSWYGDMLHPPKPLAKLTERQKQIAYLFALGFNRLEIARFLYPDDWNKEEDRILLNRVAQHQLAIGAAFRKAGYWLPNTGQEALVQLLRHNLHEIRPVVVPLYPSFRVDEAQRLDAKKEQTKQRKRTEQNKG